MAGSPPWKPDVDTADAYTGTSLSQYGVYLRREKKCAAKHYLAHRTGKRSTPRLAEVLSE